MIHASLKSKWDEDICLMVNVDNNKWNYLCDCGSASLLKAGDCTKVKGIFISHTHVDHFINFDTILRHQLGTGKKVIICGPAGIGQNVLGKIKGYNWNLIEEGSVTYEIREIKADGRVEVYKLEPPAWGLIPFQEINSKTIFEQPEFSVRYEILDHGIPSIAYLFEEKTKLKITKTPFTPGPWISLLKKAYKTGQSDKEIIVNGDAFLANDLFQYLYEKKGFRLGFVMDHLSSKENHEKIVNLCSEADQLYIEAYYRNVDEAYALKNHHSTAKASGMAAREAKVKNVYFAHHSRRYSTEIEDLVEEARAAFEGRKPKFREEPVARF